eukprot:gene7241-5090_t
MPVTYGSSIPPGIEAPTKGEVRVRIDKLILDDEAINQNPCFQFPTEQPYGGAAPYVSPNRFLVPVDHCAVAPLFWGEPKPSVSVIPSTPAESRGPFTLVYPIKASSEDFHHYLQTMAGSPHRGVQLEVYVPSSFSGRHPMPVGKAIIDISDLAPRRSVSGWFTVGASVCQEPPDSDASPGGRPAVLISVGRVKVSFTMVFFSRPVASTAGKGQAKLASVGRNAAAESSSGGRPAKQPTQQPPAPSHLRSAVRQALFDSPESSTVEEAPHLVSRPYPTQDTTARPLLGQSPAAPAEAGVPPVGVATLDPGPGTTAGAAVPGTAPQPDGRAGGLTPPAEVSGPRSSLGPSPSPASGPPSTLARAPQQPAGAGAALLDSILARGRSLQLRMVEASKESSSHGALNGARIPVAAADDACAAAVDGVGPLLADVAASGPGMLGLLDKIGVAAPMSLHQRERSAVSRASRPAAMGPAEADDSVVSSATDDTLYTSEGSDDESLALQLHKEASRGRRRHGATAPASDDDTALQSPNASIAAAGIASLPAEPPRSAPQKPSPPTPMPAPLRDDRGQWVTHVEMEFSRLSFARTDATANLEEMRINVCLSRDVTTVYPSAGPFSSYVHPVPLSQDRICLSFAVNAYSEERSKLVIEFFKVKSRPIPPPGASLLPPHPQLPREVVSETPLGLCIVGLFQQERGVAVQDPIHNVVNAYAQLRLRLSSAPLEPAAGAGAREEGCTAEPDGGGGPVPGPLSYPGTPATENAPPAGSSAAQQVEWNRSTAQQILATALDTHAAQPSAVHQSMFTTAAEASVRGSIATAAREAQAGELDETSMSSTGAALQTQVPGSRNALPPPPASNRGGQPLSGQAADLSTAGTRHSSVRQSFSRSPGPSGTVKSSGDATRLDAVEEIQYGECSVAPHSPDGANSRGERSANISMIPGGAAAPAQQPFAPAQQPFAPAVPPSGRCRCHIAILNAKQVPQVAVVPHGQGQGCSVQLRTAAATSADHLREGAKSVVNPSGDGLLPLFDSQRREFHPPSTFFVVEEIYSGVDGRAATTGPVMEWTVEAAVKGHYDRTEVVRGTCNPIFDYEGILSVPLESVVLTQSPRRASPRRGGSDKAQAVLSPPPEVPAPSPCLRELQLSMWHKLEPQDALFQPRRDGQSDEEFFWSNAAYVGECRVDLRPLKYLPSLQGYYRVTATGSPPLQDPPRVPTVASSCELVVVHKPVEVDRQPTIRYLATRSRLPVSGASEIKDGLFPLTSPCAFSLIFDSAFKCLSSSPLIIILIIIIIICVCVCMADVLLQSIWKVSLPRAMNSSAAGTKKEPVISEELTEQMKLVDNYYVSVADPVTHALPESVKDSPFLGAYLAIRSIKMQAVLALNFIPAFVVVCVQLFSAKGVGSWYTAFTMFVYVAEFSVVTLYYRSTRAAFDQLLMIAEPACVWLCFMFEVVAWSCHTKRSIFVVVSVARLFLWMFHSYSRWLQFRLGVRCLCSADRRRYQSEGFDLDLAYITRNISAMAWPATNFEMLFRNSMSEVVNFFASKHPNSYRVVNLCSERTYDKSCFADARIYAMDDHNPGELELLLRFCVETHAFIQEDPVHRTVSVHCKGGKGRTGTMICCYLLYAGMKTSADAALHHFARLRTKVGSHSFQGVQAPSQDRYVRYFETLMTIPRQVIPTRPLRIRKLRLHSIPPLWYMRDVGRLWFTIIQRPSSERNVLFLSNEDVTFESKVWDPSTYTSKQFRDLFATDEDNLYNKCNVMDPTDSAAETVKLGYRLDTTSFAISKNTSGVPLSHREFYEELRSAATPPPDLAVSLEFLRVDELPQVDGDVCIKFFFARNNPNPLEPPVQVWFHTGFVNSMQMHLPRDQIDGPHKDTKCTRYPSDFAIEIGLEEGRERFERCLSIFAEELLTTKRESAQLNIKGWCVCESNAWQSFTMSSVAQWLLFPRLSSCPCKVSVFIFREREVVNRL